MTDVYVKLPEEVKEVTIIPIADIHIGNPACRIDLLNAIIRKLKEEPNTYCILNGDLCDGDIGKHGVKSVMESQMSPMEQMYRIIGLFKDVVDKILLISDGNHEGWTDNATSMNITQIIARELGIEDRYAPSLWCLYLQFGKQTNHGRQIMYSIAGHHGSGGGITPGAKANKIIRLNQIIPTANVYIMSHVHSGLIMPTSIYVPNPLSHHTYKLEQTYVINNSLLDYPAYAEQKMLPLTSMALNMIKLHSAYRKVDSFSIQFPY